MEISASPVKDFDELGRLWRHVEAGVPDLPFFRSWSWIGCLAEERFPDPVLLQAREGGEVVGLALFNRRRGRLFLGESGDATLDAPFVEHNGPLAHPVPGVEAALLRAAAASSGVHRLVLSGIPEDILQAAPGVTWRSQERAAPWVDLQAIRDAGGRHLETLSANTRYQLRRSARHFSEPLLERAESLGEALAWLDKLVALHERSWRARGKPGAFASPWVQRFHAELVRRAKARDELDLMRLTSAGRVLGFLYNFRLRGRVFAYQSGLETREIGAHGKPGLTAHALAIQRAVEAGDLAYDFLAGGSRYKRSLSNAEAALHWVELVPHQSLAGLALRLARRIGLRKVA